MLVRLVYLVPMRELSRLHYPDLGRCHKFCEYWCQLPFGHQRHQGRWPYELNFSERFRRPPFFRRYYRGLLRLAAWPMHCPP